MASIKHLLNQLYWQLQIHEHTLDLFRNVQGSTQFA